MGCLLVLLAAFAPRLIVVFAWIARPVYFDAVFDTWIFPLLGLIFLPFTTLIWLLVGAPPQGVDGLDWLWVVLAVFLDLSHYANTYEQRDTVSAGMGRNPSPPTGTPRRTGDAPTGRAQPSDPPEAIRPTADAFVVNETAPHGEPAVIRGWATGSRDSAGGLGAARVGRGGRLRRHRPVLLPGS